MNWEKKSTYQKVAKLKYHVCLGTKLNAFRDGWTESGRDYYIELLEMCEEMRSDTLFWGQLISHWNDFMKK